MIKASLYRLRIPLKKTFDHARKQRNVADSVLLKIDYKGVVGWGECAPRDYVTGEDSLFVFNEVIQSQPKVRELLYKCQGKEPFSFFDAFFKINKHFSPNVRCVVEMALLDWFGRFYNLPLSTLLAKSFFNKPVLKKEHVFKTTQVLDLSLSVKSFLETRGPFYCIKIKANADLALLCEKVRAIREAVGFDIPLIIDANMAWSYEQAVTNCQALEQFNIAFYEEPLAQGSFYDYGKLRKATHARILLDESLCSYEDAANAIKYKSADGFNIRVSKCGGLLSCIRLIELARKNNIAFQLGAQVAEVGPLIAAARHLRMVVPDVFTFEAGQPDYLFDHYLVDPMPLVDRQTNLAYSIPVPGLGIAFSEIPKNIILNSAELHEAKWEVTCPV